MQNILSFILSKLLQWFEPYFHRDKNLQLLLCVIQNWAPHIENGRWLQSRKKMINCYTSAFSNPLIDLYVTYVFPHKDVSYGVAFMLRPALGIRCPKTQIFALSFSSEKWNEMCRIFKRFYYQKYCSDNKQTIFVCTTVDLETFLLATRRAAINKCTHDGLCWSHLRRLRPPTLRLRPKLHWFILSPCLLQTCLFNI